MLVQGRRVPSVGETRGRLREGVSEVEMVAGRLKEDGLDAMLVMEGRSFGVLILSI